MSQITQTPGGVGTRYTPNPRAESSRWHRPPRRESLTAPLPPEAAARPAAGGKRVRTDDVIYFATQLAVMVDTGVPLTDALDAVRDQTAHPGLKVLVAQIGQEIRGGLEFSAALEKRPRVFGKLFVSLVRASEASGKMGLMLQRASHYLQEERELRKKIKGALVYPVCMLVFSFAIVTGMLVFVLPRFEKIYAGKGVVLPAPTRFLLGLSGAMIAYWYLFVLGAMALLVGGCLFFRTPRGRETLDLLRIRMPLLGGMYQKACLARCLRAMATMVSAGVGTLDVLAITAQVAGNSYYETIWRRLGRGVEQGSSLAENLLQHRLVPRGVTQMIAAGEKTGRLAEVLDRVAEFCENDVRVAAKTVATMVEPAMIIIMGLVIGAIALALLLPIFSISRVVAS